LVSTGCRPGGCWRSTNSIVEPHNRQAAWVAFEHSGSPGGIFARRPVRLVAAETARYPVPEAESQ
jgi:hypothetical protein